MNFPDVIPDDRTSITDEDEWRQFCEAASKDLSMIRDGVPVLRRILEGVTYAEMRYEWIADKIEELFGPWRMFSILEVGGGYGGQARFMMDRYPCMYTILDLPEPVKLQQAYLAAHGHNLIGLAKRYDLFISNYALTEMTRDYQRHYLKLAARCLRGYITWNGWSHDTFSKDEFQSLAPAGVWIEEGFRQNHPDNACYVWGMDE